MKEKKKTELEEWIDGQIRKDPDLRRHVHKTLQGMRLEQETAAFFAERRRRADRKEFNRLMRRTGGEPPREGDEIIGEKEEMKAEKS